MKRFCVDRLLPRDLARPHVTTVNRAGRIQAVAPINKQWPRDQVLTVAFMDGTTTQRDEVRNIVPQWSTKCGIRFDFRASLPAMIRISFDPNDGSWSYLGTDCASIPANQPTMNLGWSGQDVILHEFGHTLSFGHEHQNPRGNAIQWNESAVIADLSGPPNYWDEATIRHNVLERYSVEQSIGNEFDPQSIMLYSFPASWTTNGFSAPWNQNISTRDASLSEQMYPKTAQPPVEVMKLPLRLAQGCVLSRPGEIVERELVMPAPGGDCVIETAGLLDLVLSLYKADGGLIAEDDDSGRRANSRVEATLSPGTYRVAVRHYNNGTGKFRLMAWA